jgi:hypothetical protein
MLKCENNSPKIEKEVLKGAKECFKNYDIEDNRINAIFDHGHWWVRFFDNSEEIERTFSVIDAEGIGTYNGFDYEEV